jgi:hypothetical protein
VPGCTVDTLGALAALIEKSLKELVSTVPEQ